MGERKKYIIDEYGNVALFSEVATHADVARSMHGGIVGAGFFHVVLTHHETGRPFDVEVYGKSISLGVGNRGEEDVTLIRKFL